ENVDVSILKIVMFSTTVAAVFAAFGQAGDVYDEVERWLSRLVTTIIVFSFPLIVMPLGYVANERGFHGSLIHPQVFGVFLAMALVYLVCRALITDTWS